MMKIKIFALIMAILCILTVFSACDFAKNGQGEDETPCATHTDADADNICDVCSEAMPVVCNPHKDENADKICDACGLAIVVITQLVPPTEEERVDMVVKPLPENNNLSDYDSFEKIDTVTSFEKIEGNIRSIYNGRYAYIVNTIDDENTGDSYYEYVIMDIVTGETVYKTDNKDGETVEFDFSVGSYYSYYFFKVTEKIMNEDTSEDEYLVYEFIDFNGEVLFDVMEAYEDVTEWSDHNNFTAEYNIGIYYCKFDNTVYAFDAFTAEKIATLDELSLVYRPDYDYTTEDYGYVYKDNTVFVYDLTNWIECLYSYTIPSYYENASRFYINDGKILVQAEVALLDGAVSYDFIQYGSKYDLVYVVIDPATKTATEVEFGYYITSAWDNSTEEKALNGFNVCPIVDDRINYNQKYTLVTDKDFNVTVCLDDNSNFYFVDENVILVEESIGYNNNYGEVTVEKLVNATTGELIAYVNADANIYSSYINYYGKYYDFNMNLILDLEAEEFTVSEQNGNYMLLEKQVVSEDDPYNYITELYFFSADNGAVKLDFDNADIISSNDLGFIVSREVEKTDEETGNNYTTTVYSFVNNENELVFTSDSYFYQYSQYEDGYIFYSYDGSYYTAK